MSKVKLRKPHPPPITMNEKTRKAIEESAYYRWLNRGANHGLDVDDWLEAEQQVMQNVFDRDPEE